MIRLARTEEMDAVFMMGFDAWGAGKTQEEYLKECRTSKKYKKGQWYVLIDRSTEPASSLIIYEISANTVGIGSVSTLPKLRKRGHATLMISQFLSSLEPEIKNVFLFADSSPKFYEKFGFVRLPKKLQKNPGSVCMLRAANAKTRFEEPNFAPPQYF